MKTKTIRLRDVSYTKLFPSGMWEASCIYGGYLVRGRGETKRCSLDALRHVILNQKP